MFGEFDGFVEDDFVRCRRVDRKFGEAEAQDVAINGGHALDVPVGRDGGDFFVEFVAVLEDAVDQLAGEFDALAFGASTPVALATISA